MCVSYSLEGENFCFAHTTGGGSSRRWRASPRRSRTRPTACPPAKPKPPAAELRAWLEIAGRQAGTRLIQVVAEHLGTGWVAQLRHGLGLDLADPLPGHPVDLADL